jgi:hypothetical protein
MSSALSWKNYVTQHGFSGGGAGGGSIDPSYPLANAADPDPSKVCRVNYTAAGPGGVYLLGDLGAIRSPIRVIAALNCALSTLEVPAANQTAFSFRLYDSAFGATGADLQIANANIVPIPGTRNRFNLFCVAPANVTTGRYLIMYPDIGSATHSGWFEVGHLWAGPALVFPEGTDTDWGLSAVDTSEVTRARGGALVASRMPRRKKLSIGFSGRSYAETIGTAGDATALSLRDFALDAGVSTPVLAIHRSTDTHAMQAASIYGAVTRPLDIQHERGNYYKSRLEIEEIR